MKLWICLAFLVLLIAGVIVTPAQQAELDAYQRQLGQQFMIAPMSLRCTGNGRHRRPVCRARGGRSAETCRAGPEFMHGPCRADEQ